MSKDDLLLRKAPTTPPIKEPESPRFRGAFRGADERARTVDLLHGKQTLYQLSYIRERPEYSHGFARLLPLRSP